MTIAECQVETIKHIETVRKYIKFVCDALMIRAIKHDATKLESPEVEIFTEYTPKLAQSTYGSEEYNGFLREMKTALQHHYAANRDLISSYSHGMKQKLAIISALVHQPKLLILDEPFVGLDPQAAVVLKNIMREICASGGAIFFSTHVLDVAEKLCNKVAIIKDGVLIKSGLMDEIVHAGESLEDIFMEVVCDAKTDL